MDGNWQGSGLVVLRGRSLAKVRGMSKYMTDWTSVLMLRLGQYGCAKVVKKIKYLCSSVTWLDMWCHLVHQSRPGLVVLVMIRRDLLIVLFFSTRRT